MKEKEDIGRRKGREGRKGEKSVLVGNQERKVMKRVNSEEGRER